MGIKPANTLLMINPDGTGKVAKLADFGLSLVAFEIVEDRSRVRSINEHRQLQSLPDFVKPVIVNFRI